MLVGGLQLSSPKHPVQWWQRAEEALILLLEHVHKASANAKRRGLIAKRVL